MGIDDDQLNGGAAPQDQQQQDQVTDDDRGGLDAEEFALMEQMREADGGQSAVDQNQPGDGAPAATQQQAPAADGDGDDDDDTDPAQQVGADGKQVEPKPGDPPRQKRVSFAKYKAAQDEAERLRAEVQTQAVTQGKLKERLDIMAEAWRTPGATVPQGGAQTQQQAPAQQQAAPAFKVPTPEELIDPNVDIFGAFNQMRDLATAAAQAVTQIQTMQGEAVQDQEQATAYVEDSREFLSREPTFLMGYQHLMDTRAEQLAQMWFQKSASPTAPVEQRVSKVELNQIKQAMVREEKQLVREALKNGRSPAETIFNLAKTFRFDQAAALEKLQAQRNGTQQQPAPAAQQQQQPTLADIAAGRAQAPAPAASVPSVRPTAQSQQPAPQQQSTVADEISAIKNNVERSTSLSQGNGAPVTTITPQFIANMTDDQFSEWMDTASPEQLRAVMGE